MKRRIYVLDRDICSGYSDLTIVPCSGKMKQEEKPRNQARIDCYGLPRPFDLKDKFKFGEISPIFRPKRNGEKIKYFAFAASVYNKSDLKAIERIGEQIGAITMVNKEIRNVETPFLGCGDGNLHPKDAMPALARGFLSSSHPDAVLHLCSDSALSVSEAMAAINKQFPMLAAKEDSGQSVPTLGEPTTPPLQSANGRTKSSTATQYPVIVLVTVNDNETNAVFDAFLGEGKAPKHITISGITYNDLGIHGGHRLVNTICEMGAGGIGASQQRTRQAIAHWQPRAIIAVGIAFGLDETKQGIGDVLVSTQIQDYDLGRINKDGTLTPRGDKPSCADVLLNRLRQADARERRQRRSDWPKVRFGLVLSGQKLVDNHNYRQSLKALSPEAIGGEMEGIGLYVSASEAKVDWIIVKGICDWGHNKNRRQKDVWQSRAAINAACVLKTSLDAGSLYSSEYVSPVEARTTRPSEKEDTWAETEKTHELKEIFQDIRFYVRKGLTDEEQMTSEWLCTNCWTDKIKSIIQREGSKDNITTYFCPRCKTQFKWNRTIAVTTYNPFLKITDVTDTPEYKAINLDNIAVNILLRLWKFPDGLTDKMIAKMLNLDIQTVTDHIEKLEQEKMICAHWRPPRKWTLKQDGRGYLIERNLVS